MFSAAVAGLGAGMTLIIAIGAQNAFVLRQGIRKEHVFAICLLCAVADAVLITCGILGLGIIVESAPIALAIIRWAGAAFLIGYAILAIRRAIRPGLLIAADSESPGLTLGAALAQTAAFTFLNPHVYLDSVLLLGSMGNTYGLTGRWFFDIGAVSASFIWFFALGYGARLLIPIFAKPLAWRILDSLIAAVMLAIAASLLFGAGDLTPLSISS